MKHKAVLVGINYPNTDHALRGCINDVTTIKNVLINHYNFKLEDITLLTDQQATTANIVSALQEMVQSCAPGDVLFFHFSGHGSQVYSKSEADGLDEILCPIDLNWRDKIITDNTLKEIFDKVPNGVRFTVLLDCCNSGSGLDHDDQFQPIVESTRSVVQPEQVMSRYLPPPAIFLERARKHREKVSHKPTIKTRDINKTGMLISGCRAEQTSADAFIDKRYIGACTHFLTTILKEHDYCISYIDLINELNKRLAQHGFTQRPQLDGPQTMHELPFIVCTNEKSEQPHKDRKMVDNSSSWLNTVKQWLRKIFS